MLRSLEVQQRTRIEINFNECEMWEIKWMEIYDIFRLHKTNLNSVNDWKHFELITWQHDSNRSARLLITAFNARRRSQCFRLDRSAACWIVQCFIGTLEVGENIGYFVEFFTTHFIHGAIYRRPRTHRLTGGKICFLRVIDTRASLFCWRRRVAFLNWKIQRFCLFDHESLSVVKQLWD